MDAKCRKRRRESSCASLREQRWSMSSQRLEQVIAEMMKPVRSLGQSFDRNDVELMEEYLTSIGIRILDSEMIPNYAEVGLVVQSVVSNFSRKVDHIFKLGLTISSELNGLTECPDTPDAAETSPEGGGGARRRRGAAGGAAGAGAAGRSLARVRLVNGGAGRRAPACAAPPPTLPRLYAELQPRAPRPDRQLQDHRGDLIGALDDFRVTWPLQHGYLTEDLAWTGAEHEGPARALPPLSLLELQEACLRGAATPSDEPRAATPPDEPRAATPPDRPGADTPPAAATPPPAALRRKRTTAEARLLDLSPGCLNFFFDIAEASPVAAEYRLSARWIARVVRHRRDALLRGRRELSPAADLHFAGWTGDQLRAAADDAERAGLRLQRALAPPPPPPPSPPPPPPPEVAGSRAPPLVLAALDADVRLALPAPGGAVPWGAVWEAARVRQPRAGRVLLDVLLKAQRGEVSIEPGAPLSVNEFTVRVLTEARPLRPGDDDWLEPPPPVP